MTSVRPREGLGADGVPRLLRAFRLWTAAAAGSAFLFGLGLAAPIGSPLSPGALARLVLLLQPIVSIGLPVALVMVARAVGPSPVTSIWAWTCSGVSGVAWVTYDLANLHRLVPFTRPHVLAGVAIPEIVPFGWWARNFELLGSALLIWLVATTYGRATASSRRSTGVVTASLILAVLTKSTVLLIFQHAAARGERRTSAFALFAGISLLSQLVQHVSSVAVGALGAKQLAPARATTRTSRFLRAPPGPRCRADVASR